MLSRGFRIFFGVGIVMVLFALGLHAVYRFYNAPADAEYDLLNVFAATFASTILAFFIGALLFDYQVERAEAKRNKQLRTLLATELNVIAEGLDFSNVPAVRLASGSEVKVVITHGQPPVVEQAIREGSSTHRGWRGRSDWRGTSALTTLGSPTCCRSCLRERPGTRTLSSSRSA